ncbi:MAG: hypothetical protein U9R47_11050, partial [Actinomycetota bacterium]|nr:hypothetical protein [Actinomycetota bacterium]
TPTQHKPQPSTAAPTARRRVWAFAAGFAAVLLVIGATTLALRGSDTPVANEPATPTTVGVEQSTPDATNPDSLMIGVDPQVFLGAWQQVAVDGTPTIGIVDVEALPDGGFVAVTWEPDPWGVIWSPDGVEWHDADPQRQMPQITVWAGTDKPRSVEVTADQVVILDQANVGVWVGDPQTGQWEPIRLDTSGFDARWTTMTLAANDSEALVVATSDDQIDGEGSTTQTGVWLVDTSEHTSTRTSLPTTVASSGVMVEWLNDRWIMLSEVTDPYGCSAWMSPDGASWTENALPEGLNEYCGSSLTAGPSGVIVTRSSWGEDNIWYSPDGIDWELVYLGGFVLTSTYSETPGYVVSVGVDYEDEAEDGDPSDYGVEMSGALASADGGAILVSTDGKTWHLAGPGRPGRPEGARLLAASNDKLLHHDRIFRLWLWTNN